MPQSTLTDNLCTKSPKTETRCSLDVVNIEFHEPECISQSIHFVIKLVPALKKKILAVEVKDILNGWLDFVH